ncbi:hypothetical protein ACKLNO_03590 [Neisseriaceae bacterium B1]
MTEKVYLALYKGKKSGKGAKVQLARLMDWLIRKITRGQYSHCEIAIRLNPNDKTQTAQYRCYSASLRDGGVRAKTMPLPADKWDLIHLDNNAALRQAVEQIHYVRTQGQGYDYLGALGIVLPFHQRANKWFCSEWCAASLGLAQPERYSPNSLAQYFQAA